MHVAVLSIPSCMTVEQSQLEMLKDQGAVNNYEFSADNSLLTLYWTYLKANEEKNVSISRVVTNTGTNCIERASRAWNYYDDANTVWLE